MSVIDEEVNGTVDGLEKIVEADEDSERLWRNTEATLVKVEEIESAEFQMASHSLRLVCVNNYAAAVMMMNREDSEEKHILQFDGICRLVFVGTGIAPGAYLALQLQ